MLEIYHDLAPAYRYLHTLRGIELIRDGLKIKILPLPDDSNDPGNSHLDDTFISINLITRTQDERYNISLQRGAYFYRIAPKQPKLEGVFLSTVLKNPLLVYKDIIADYIFDKQSVEVAIKLANIVANTTDTKF